MFYFDLFDGGQQIGRDDDGTELEDLAKARQEAVMALAELAEDAVRHAGALRALMIRVRDETGTPVLETELSFTCKALLV